MHRIIPHCRIHFRNYSSQGTPNMPLYARHFFIEDSYMGKGLVESTFTRGSAFHPPVEIIPPSLVYFCPVCGNVWASLSVWLPDGSRSRYHAITSACHRHSTSSWQCPGSLRTGTDEKLEASFPSDVIRWEFDVHIAWWDNWKGTAT